MNGHAGRQDRFYNLAIYDTKKANQRLSKSRHQFNSHMEPIAILFQTPPRPPIRKRIPQNAHFRAIINNIIISLVPVEELLYCIYQFWDWPIMAHNWSIPLGVGQISRIDQRKRDFIND